MKITQLREIFTVRWAVFLLGPAGCGKTAVWKTLINAQIKHGEKSRSIPINPKAVTRNELYGFMHPSTREWKEGTASVLSQIQTKRSPPLFDCFSALLVRYL